MCSKCDKDTTLTKLCNGICGKEKTLFNFYAESFNKTDGHRGTCKDCDAIRFKIRQEKIRNSPKEYVEFKKCGQCKEIRHRDLFAKDSTAKTGLKSKCAICVKEMCQTEVYKKYSSDMAKKQRVKDRESKELALKIDKLANPEKYIVLPKPPRKKKPFEIKTYVEFKLCTGNDSCGELKHRDEFTVNNYISTGLNNTCRKCDREIANLSENKEKAKIIRQKYLSDQDNKRKAQNTANTNAKRKRNTDPIFKLRGNVSNKICFYLKLNDSSKNGKSILKFLPYTISELRTHIESQWLISGNEWMNWDNYGKISSIRKTWHIDHIIPQSLLPYDSMEHPNFQKCWALSNLRPLEAFENIRKSNKLISDINAESSEITEDIDFIQLDELKSA